MQINYNHARQRIPLRNNKRNYIQFTLPAFRTVSEGAKRDTSIGHISAEVGLFE